MHIRHWPRINTVPVSFTMITNLPQNATGCNITMTQSFHTLWVAYSDNGGATWTAQQAMDIGIGHDASTPFVQPGDLLRRSQLQPQPARLQHGNHRPQDRLRTHRLRRRQHRQHAAGSQPDQRLPALPLDD